MQTNRQHYPYASGTSDAPSMKLFLTQSVGASDRFDYWRQLFVASYLDKPRHPDSGDFRGRLIRSTTHGNVTFVSHRADPIVSAFGRRESGLVLLGRIHSGRVRVFQNHGETADLGSGSGLVLFDCDRPATTYSTRYEMSHLVLPRSLVAAALGEDPVPRGMAARRIPDTGLAPILQAHLAALAEHGQNLNAVELQCALGAAGSLALTLLAGLGAATRLDDDTVDDALLASAERQIALNLGNPAFTADRLAGLLGCSRSHLYRLFARHGKTVAGRLREVRLRRARALLETHWGEPIGTIALRCGYPDLSAFGKVFRRHFGVSASDCRDAARSARRPG